MITGWWITALTVFVVFSGLWVVYSIEGWWRWLDSHSGVGWFLLKLLFLPFLIISYPLILILTILGIYSAATTTRDWWNKQ